ncbi:hypothetical protein P692DRAFT_201809304 [Suillus brevipes Sb2]|nr:hypothetical protein P692DRAFT_201809304 [Suillus brevipes Sb2]
MIDIIRILHLPATFPVNPNSDSPLPPLESDPLSESDASYEPPYENSTNSDSSESDSESSSAASDDNSGNRMPEAGPSHFAGSLNYIPTPSNSTATGTSTCPPRHHTRSLSLQTSLSLSRSATPTSLSRSATPTSLSRSATPALERSKTMAERLRDAEEEVGWLRRENELLTYQKDAAETHCYFSSQMAEHYKERLNKRLEDKSRKGPGKKRMKPYSRVLTSEEGRMELMELEAEQAERERQEEVSKQKKAAEEQGKRDRRAEQERSQVAFTGAIKTKKLDELRDIAAALRLPETGLKAELLQRIVQFFDDQPELKKNQRYEGLFNPSRSRRRHVEIGNNTTGSVPQNTPIHQHLIHTPFNNYQSQPIPQPSLGSSTTQCQQIESRTCAVRRVKVDSAGAMPRGGTNLQHSKFVEGSMKWLTSYKRFAENVADYPE